MVFPGEGPPPVVGNIAFEARPTVMPVADKVDPRSCMYPYPSMVQMWYERELILQSVHFNGQTTYEDYARALQLRDQFPYKAFDLLLKVLKDLHGHNFRVRVTATHAFPVDQPHPAALVWDEELEKVVREWDRTNLSVHPDLEGKRATTEVLCEVLQAKLKKKFPDPHWMVEIWETSDIRAVVR